MLQRVLARLACEGDALDLRQLLCVAVTCKALRSAVDALPVPAVYVRLEDAGFSCCARDISSAAGALQHDERAAPDAAWGLGSQWHSQQQREKREVRHPLWCMRQPIALTRLRVQRAAAVLQWCANNAGRLARSALHLGCVTVAHEVSAALLYDWLRALLDAAPGMSVRLVGLCVQKGPQDACLDGFVTRRALELLAAHRELQPAFLQLEQLFFCDSDAADPQVQLLSQCSQITDLRGARSRGVGHACVSAAPDPCVCSEPNAAELLDAAAHAARLGSPVPGGAAAA